MQKSGKTFQKQWHKPHNLKFYFSSDWSKPQNNVTYLQNIIYKSNCKAVNLHKQAAVVRINIPRHLGHPNITIQEGKITYNNFTKLLTWTNNLGNRWENLCVDAHSLYSSKLI